jgi:maltose/maltodextrin transport system permease protein
VHLAVFSAEPEQQGRLSIWIGADKGVKGLRELGQQFYEQTGVVVTVAHPDAVPDKFSQAAATGQGPDIMIWAHDRIGEWAQSGLISPIDPRAELRDQIESFAWPAATYKGQLWGYPLAVEAAGLIYNTAMVPDPPHTFDDVIALHRVLEPQGKWALLWDYNTPFYSWSLMAANGGYAYAYRAGEYDITDIGVASSGARQGGYLIRQLIEAGVMPRGMTYSVVEAAFNRGDAAIMISGPWAWPNIERSGIDFGVAPIPAVGQHSSPALTGVLLAMINATTLNRLLAIEFIEHLLLTTHGLRTMNVQSTLSAVPHKAYMAELGVNPRNQTTFDNAKAGQLMPNIPEMGAFWSAMAPALANITSGRQSVDDALDDAARRIAQCILWTALGVRKTVYWAAWVIFTVAALYWVATLYRHGQWPLAVLSLVLAAGACFVYARPDLQAQRYVYPAIAGMVAFVGFPLIYTLGMAYTNYSASNLLTFTQAQVYLLAQNEPARMRYPFVLHDSTDGVRLRVNMGDRGMWVSPPLTGEPATQDAPAALYPDAPISTELGPALDLRARIQWREELMRWHWHDDEGDVLQLYTLRDLAPRAPRYVRGDNDVLFELATGRRLYADHHLGYHVDESGGLVAPGFVVYAGLANFQRVLMDSGIRGPFISIFLWTMSFAALSVGLTLILGLLLANLLQWGPLRGRTFYRVMLILPAAVPSFISILVFLGLFNQNAGEINLMLDALFGLQPEWFSHTGYARTMLLVVNTWLGYPYMMLLCMGFMQAIPRDLYEASALDGAGVWANLRHITAPLLLRPLAPLLIASFAFNFNNFVLIGLLTSGGPDFVGAATPAGTTDLLVSYTYRIAFQDSGQHFALAAAIATFIFVLVGLMAWLNLRVIKIEV